MFIGAVFWAHFTNVEKVAITTGQILPSGYVHALQHLEGGIVQQILVREGELVEAGAVLVRLNPTAAQAELDQVRAREVALELQAERLRAFAEQRNPQLNRQGGSNAQLRDDQRTIFRMQDQARASQREVLQRQLAARRAELATIEEQYRALTRQVRSLAQTLAMRRELLEKGLTSRIVYLDTEREHSRLSGELAQSTSNINRAREAVAEAEARLQETENRLATDSLSEMGRLSAELAQVRESLSRAEDRVQRLDIRAPVRGLVKDLRVRAVGGVIAPGASVVDVVPVGQELVAEVKISPRDIGFVKIGQEVWTKVTAYDFARYGIVPGHLKGYSATTYQDPDGQLYFRGVVALTRTHVNEKTGQHPLLPGMVVQADVKLGDRSVLEYLFTPIYASLRSAFHER
jgi:HlyD family secretion protein/adhesin transport system membrane fusion protein